MSEMKLGSLFSGQEGFGLAGMLSGIDLAWSCEIEPAPMMVLKKRFPDVAHYSDVSQLKGDSVEKVNIVTFGSPCQDLSVAGKRAGMKHSLNGDENQTRSGLFFDAVRIIEEMRDATNNEFPRYALWENVCFGDDAIVTTQRGLIKISEVVVGDIVKTHNGEWHVVKKVHKNKNKEVLRVSFQCNVEPITVTPNHPFYVRRHFKNGSSSECFSEPTWKPIGEMDEEDFVGFKLDGFGNKSIGSAKAYAVGRWLADGSYANRSRNTGINGGQMHRIFISTGYKKFDALKKELSKLPYAVRENKMNHAVNLTFCSDEFYDLISECGRGARNKKVPQWIFELTELEQKEVLRGYLDGDGYCRRAGEWHYSSSSKELAYGIARLVRNIYKTGVCISYKPAKGTVNIEGRTVNANEYWSCYFKERDNNTQYINSSIYIDGYVWCRLKEKEVFKTTDVYNLSVEDVNSYEVNGISVHNCGAYSSAKGEDFKRVLEELLQVVDINIEIPTFSKWPGNGEVIGNGFSLAWRTFDAQYWGVPQRRRRIYLLVDYQSENAGKVMFRNEGEDFRDRQRAWTEFGKTCPQMTADECVDLFNERPWQHGDGEDFGINEPSGKFARLDLNALVPVWNTDIPDGYFIGEKPYWKNPTKLSEILIPNADSKYYLSAKACQGILRRARERGKKLPDVLRIALENQANENT